ncbi:hypothetical protein HXX76_011700 [Chlamydomonas incerta]|uniref:Uncharacterized protein n=1 Tax=Chlamydomonas incerta TaxID=51695 RepID=A0A835STR2_CHLIN|nr:hypothetical protein HXX76_011700 [Chlamydomonas incerta]|eukprot:KAG2426470.1 hypothetical protein HXX76_011700 [Chlamydomonas incerta]
MERRLTCDQWRERDVRDDAGSDVDELLHAGARQIGLAGAEGPQARGGGGHGAWPHMWMGPVRGGGVDG